MDKYYIKIKKNNNNSVHFLSFSHSISLARGRARFQLLDFVVAQGLTCSSASRLMSDLNDIKTDLSEV